MKYALFVALLVATFSSAFGQILGRVTDATGEPIAFANVVLYLVSDSSFVGGISTEEDGHFNITHSKTGSYYLQISSISYQVLRTPAFAIGGENSSYDLGDLLLLEESNDLAEVVVSARKDLIQTTPIGKIVNVQGSLMTKGSNALQLLERLPGILLDRRNGQFSLNGQSGVTVLFDGRRVQMGVDELMALLESTVADNIEKVELITSPTAQYDADGGAGVINIVFKKRVEQGTRGNLSATAGYGFREKAVTSVGLSRGFKKADFNATYSFSHDAANSGFRGHGTSNNPIMGGVSNGLFSNFTERVQNTHNLNLAAEYRPTERTAIGGELSISFSKANNLADIQNVWDVQDVEYIRSRALSDGHNKRRNLIASVYLKRKLSAKSQLNFDLSFIGYHNDSPTTISATYFDRQGNEYMPNNENFIPGNRGESLSKINVGVFKGDYSWKISEWINAEFGAKGSYTHNTNDSKVERNVNGIWELDPRSQSSIFGDELVVAAYSQWRFKLDDKTNLQVGLRYEYWQRDINIYDDAFVIAKPFPSLLLTHQFNERTTASLNYNRRISRPAYVDLISNLFYNDPTAIFTGNPLLKPGITDAIKADFTIKGINIALSAQQELDPILRYQLTSNEANDILIVSPQNMDYMRSLNLFLNIPFQPFDWWRLSLGSTTSLRNYQISYIPVPAEKTFVFQSLNFNESIQFPKNFELELSSWWNFPFYEGSNKLTKGFGVLNIGIAKKLSKDRGILQLVLPDLLKTFSVHTHISGMAPIVFDINSYSNWRDESTLYRVVKLSYSRSFGGQGRRIDYHFGDEERGRVQ